MIGTKLSGDDGARYMALEVQPTRKFSLADIPFQLDLNDSGGVAGDVEKGRWDSLLGNLFPFRRWFR